VLITQQDNDRARNASWDDKKQIYSKGSSQPPMLAITRDVIDEREWRQGQIEAREERLVGLIDRIWRIDILGQKSSGRTVKPSEEPEAASPVVGSAPQPQSQSQSLPGAHAT